MKKDKNNYASFVFEFNINFTKEQRLMFKKNSFNNVMIKDYAIGEGLSLLLDHIKKERKSLNLDELLLYHLSKNVQNKLFKKFGIK